MWLEGLALLWGAFAGLAVFVLLMLGVPAMARLVERFEDRADWRRYRRSCRDELRRGPGA